MIVVFWLDLQSGPYCQSFDQNDLTSALKFAEELRTMRTAGAPISHVCIQSEQSNKVGSDGVTDPNSDYAWYKRRIDPSIPLGRKGEVT